MKLHRSFHQQQDADTEVEFTAAAAGCREATGKHVEMLANTLNHLDASSLSILGRVGMLREDISDKVEILLSTTGIYK